MFSTYSEMLDCERKDGQTDRRTENLPTSHLAKAGATKTTTCTKMKMRSTRALTWIIHIILSYGTNFMEVGKEKVPYDV